MVVLSVAICTKSGKAVISRQFVEMTRIRIEGLLAAFPKLMGTELKQQHTFIETEAVRYVYQPLDSLYLLLITNRASNIVEDLDTLRLLSKVVPSVTGTTANLSEDKVAEKCFELIFALDEVITTGGYRENVNLQQIRTNMEMDSHEEKLHNMIKTSKMESARDQAAAAAKAIKDKQKEQQRLGMSSSSSYASSSAYDQPITPSFSASSLPPLPSPTVPTSSKAAVKGMSLGGTGKNKSLEEALMKEDKLAPIVASVAKAPSLDQQITAAPLIQHPLMISVSERVTAKLSRDGLAELLEVKGQFMLTAADDDVSNCSIKLKPVHAPAFTFTTHPKINKQLYEKSSTLQLKDAGKGFPSGRAVGILKWSSNGTNEDLIPLRINCWPEEESRGQVNVSIEYSMDLKGFEFHDVKIRIPLGTSAAPNVLNADGNYKHVSTNNELLWELDLIDASNSSGSLEFNIQQKNPDAFFPITVQFMSKQLYCPVEILEITSVGSGDHIQYGLSVGLSSEDYVVG